MNRNVHIPALIRRTLISALTLLLVYSTSFAQAVESYGANASATLSGGLDQTYTLSSYTMNRETNRLLVVMVSYQTSDFGFTFSASYNGGPMTKQVGSFSIPSAVDVFIMPISGNNDITSDIEITTIGTFSDVSINAFSFRNVSGNAPVDAFITSNTGSTTSSSITLPSATTDDLIVDFFRLTADPGSLTAGANQTTLVNDPTNLIAASYQRGTGNLNASWTMDNNLSPSNVHVGIRLNAGNDPLPVEMSYFYADKYDRSSVLQWGTETEINNLGFEIQWSTNGVVWERIGYAEGNGNSDQPNHYEFEDDSPMPGSNYYRLKQIDFDGSFKFSDVRIVEFEALSLETVTLYPNPAVNVLNVDNIMGKAVVYDLLGNTKIETELTSKFNKIDISNLTPGPHAIRVTLPSGEMHSWAFTKH
ncbi:MAG: hypothetical protein AAFV80_17465 [Bacteroidota bacterium]